MMKVKKFLSAVCVKIIDRLTPRGVNTYNLRLSTLGRYAPITEKHADELMEYLDSLCASQKEE